MAVAKTVLKAMEQDNLRKQQVFLTRKQKDDIIEKTIEGVSLKTIAASKELPSLIFIVKELSRDEQFKKEYYIAKAWAAEVMVTEMFEIAQSQEMDFGSKKLLIDVIKFHAAKLLRKTYGDKDPDADQEKTIRLVIERAAQHKQIVEST